MASYYLLLSFLMLPLLLFLQSKLKCRFSKQNYRLPPGPWTLPIIGSAHHLFGRRLRHHALRDSSEQYGDLMFLQLGEHPTVVVSSRQAAKEIMKTHDLKFCNRQICNALKHMHYSTKDIVFSPYSESGREMRKVAILGLLTSKRIQSLRSIHEEEVSSMIKHISSVLCTKQFFNLKDTLLSLLTDIALRSVVGSKSKEKKLIIREILDTLELITKSKLPLLFPSIHFLSVLTGVVRGAKQCRNRIEQFCGDVIEEYRQKNGSEDADDIISVLLRLYDEDSVDNRITKDNVIAVMFDLLAGITESPTTTLEWAMAELMKNPSFMERAQTEIRQHVQGHKIITQSDLVDLNIIRLIIKETMRLHPAGPLLLPKECRETCNIQGYDIPKGTIVIVNSWAMGRNSNYWKDAEEFKPERFLEADDNVESDGADFMFNPFGGGRRKCPGELFSLAVMDLVLVNLLYHFNWELPHGMSPDELDMTEYCGTTTRRKSPLLLRAIPYKC